MLQAFSNEQIKGPMQQTKEKADYALKVAQSAVKYIKLYPLFIFPEVNCSYQRFQR